ncbi:hypothetical protein H634G_11280 [Metarhizium anisopliae BRIP 53293]|uniref:Uncharacterized protein n=1 Tax=Metarhizium anisopliae BRIP 53293 TaxID=1291518 RepID=A0A0D9NID6_METAN|nr:hypothetical protein H634G_11626 [Metarhizium anisopliae BRIP 53293]KJK73478.1 hypothetical protein H634G_11280 [Metarhizium anisopliae BRIP 53293]
MTPWALVLPKAVTIRPANTILSYSRAASLITRNPPNIPPNAPLVHAMSPPSRQHPPLNQQ